jgi:hypothetical protein
MQVNVTQEHINAGERYDCRNCPVALALREATGRDWYVAPFSALSYNPTWDCIRLEQRIRDFVTDFDNSKDVQPITFEFPIGEPLCEFK